MERKQCFLDITCEEHPIGRMVIELFNDIVPKTCENFRAFCTGANVRDYTYKGCPFHRIIPNLAIQGGDIRKQNGTGSWSIYGDTFEDENFEVKHTEKGLLSMVNFGPDTNGSQFFITIDEAEELDDENVVFGRVIQGEYIIDMMAGHTSESGRPTLAYAIADCGEL